MRVKPAWQAVVLCLVVYGTASAADEGARLTPVVRVVRAWSSSVVNISTERVVELRQDSHWKRYGTIFDTFFDRQKGRLVGQVTLKGVGSGVVVSKGGLIITNAHVVNMASKVYVILADGSMHEASLAAANVQNDLALIKIDPPADLKPVAFAAEVMIGETVVAIGNSMGLENSASAGIVSGVDRSFIDRTTGEVVFDGLIQTDASVNIGNSGGALLNMDGELVGINLAVMESAQGIGFAIPASRVRGIIEEYVAYHVQRRLAGTAGN